MAVNFMPQGYHNIMPYLAVNGAATLFEFLKRTFDAQEKEMMKRPDGTIGHAEVTIGDSVAMLGEASGDFKAMPAMLYVYVRDADATYRRALQACGKSLREPATQFY